MLRVHEVSQGLMVTNGTDRAWFWFDYSPHEIVECCLGGFDAYHWRWQSAPQEIRNALVQGC